ncbi:unnamed protein product [Rotaria sp. Silwood2]|nr:unnamed protein product [Rotaria sp. Silwood2]
MFTSCLTLFGYLTNGYIYPLPKIMLDRFCLQILPEIHHKINWLDLEPLTMKHILLSANYPNLTGLGLFNIEKQTALDLLIIDYPHLKYIDFKDTHDDYVEQFLLDTKTILPYDVDIYVDYKTLKRVTHNFRRNATQINCSKATYQCFDRIVRFPKYFKDYFRDIELNMF